MTTRRDRIVPDYSERPNLRRVLNRLEPHLGCVQCRGKLDDGRCLTCDPIDGSGVSGD